MLSAAGSLHHLLTPWPAVCHGARAATRTNTRRASRSGAHIRACSSAGRVLAERCLGISRLVVCWFACASAARVGLASVYRLGYTWRRESGLALSPSGADGAPQRRTEIYVIRKTRNRAAQVPVDASFSITPPRAGCVRKGDSTGVQRKYDFVLLPTLFRHKSLMHVQTSVLKHAAASHHIRELRARDHSAAHETYRGLAVRDRGAPGRHAGHKLPIPCSQSTAS